MRKIVTLLLAALLVLTLVPAMAEETITLGVVYKQTGNPFFEAAVRGFEEAQKELGFEFIHNGPADSSNEGQIQIIEGYIQQEVDAIAISANDASGVVSVLQTAMDKGIKVISWDSAVAPEGRNLNIDPSVAENIGRVQVEEISKQIGGEGQIAILSAGATMDNQNTWIEYMKKELEKEEYAKIELVTIVYGDDLTDKSYQEMQGLIDSYPDLKGVISPTTVGVAAAASCIQDNGLTGKIKLTGLGLPSEMADYITAGVCEGMYLWNPIDLGYCAAYASVAMVKGEITGAVGETFEAGRLGTITIMDDGNGNGFTIVGDPYCFTAENIEQWKNVY
ncbi:MAG: rhamnose ABC transporter substrate-binding protein [Clostridiales bacterium]|jgi:rhamnose transport system substrate-binding protein|nr:rhamnose ABC transporter substrate-binding protein [Clostridiales bacterium]